MADANPTAAELRADFSFNPETGTITRISGQRPGHVVGYSAANGYTTITYRGRTFLAHRVAWCIETGRWPSGQIDHINGDKADNRLANLRDVDASVNSQNQHRAKRNSKTRTLGVTQTASGKFMARMLLRGKRLYLGLHDTPEDAHTAYKAAKLVTMSPI